MDYLKNLESSLLLSGVTGASLYNIAGNVAMFDEMVETAHLNGEFRAKSGFARMR